MISRVCALLRMRPPVIDNRGLLFASGATVPIDGTDGYQTGCLFQHTDGGGGTALYLNEGSVTSSEFNPVEAGTITTPPIILTGDAADALTGGGIQYGNTTTEINYTPVTGGSHSGFQVYITSEDCISGLSIAAMRTRVTLTGTTAATAYGAQFWTKIACTDFTGHYLGGHPVGCAGIIELAGTARNATSQYAVMAGVCGEVRPITTSGNVDVGGVICGLHAKIFAKSSEVDTGDVVGLFVQTLAGAASDIGILVQTHTGGAAWTTGLEFDSSYGAIANGIVFTGPITTRVIDYASETAIDEPGAGHLLRYGVSGADVPWTPTATCSGLDMYITSTGPAGGGFGLAGMRVKVTLTGTTRITANAGQFWTKIDCVDYTGHYLGGHPTGLSGIIECAGTARNATSTYAVMAGVVGEVRPISTSGNVDLGGVICGLHAKIFGVASEVNTGSVVGLFVQAIAGSAADIGILIQPHTGGAAWTTGIELDSSYGAITTGITIGTCETGIGITWASTSTTGTGADPIYGDRTADSGVQACVSAGTSATAATVTGTGSHVGFQTNLTLTGTLVQNDLYGGFLAICTVAAAQNAVNSVTAAVTGYIRNDVDGGSVIEGEQWALRGVIYTASGDESVRQCAIYGAIVDQGAHADSAEEIAGLWLDMQIAAENSGRKVAIMIQSDGSTQVLDSVIELNTKQESKFTNFLRGKMDNATCLVANTSNLGADTCIGVVVVELDDTTGYIPVLASVPSG